MKQIAGFIIAGGAASRIGGEKALLPFKGGTLVDAVITRVQPQVLFVGLNVPPASAGTYRSRYPGYPLLFDPIANSVGPLAGVIAGLEWARTLADARWLATFPCDTPFLPRDLVAQLMGGARDTPVFAHHGNQMHGICAVWPVHCLERLRAGVEDGRLRSLHSAMDALDGSLCRVKADEHAFFNVNTREDLVQAEQLATEM